MKVLFNILVLSFLSTWVIGQADDPNIFTVAGQGVPVSEFEYIYNKNNGDKANYSKASIDEYLDLYVKFKLKVQRAKDMKLDTIQALQTELEGYKKQLSNSYLVDKEVTEKLVKEAYDRSLKDVLFSHILVQIKANSSNEDVARYQKIADEIYDRIQKGESFENLVETESDDENSAKNGGKVGFVNAMLPNGFYELETALYSLEEGEVSKPVRSPLGLHILQVNKIRQAIGKVDISHILVRLKPGSEGKTEEAAIKKVHTFLKDGKGWNEAVTLFSEDRKTKTKEGKIGVLQIGQYEEDFENAAFALENDGDYSKPIKTRLGWHIIKRNSKQEIPAYNDARKKLQAQISKDKRLDIVKRQIINKIKEDGGFNMESGKINTLKTQLDESFFTYKWNVPEMEDGKLFEIGGVTYNNSDFIDYLKKNARKRLLGRRNGLVKTFDSLLDEFIDEKAIKYEEGNLSAKYPEFRNLMREYEEGVLLFEATKMKVWDKASSDTSGLKTFHSQNMDRYKWEERAVVYNVKINTQDEKVAKKAFKKLKKKSISETAVALNAMNNNSVSYIKSTVEKDDFTAGIPWSKNAIKAPAFNADKNAFEFVKVEEILPGKNKTLGEARGYVIADYQDYLEKQWVESLRKDYSVEINQQVLNRLIKK